MRTVWIAACLFLSAPALAQADRAAAMEREIAGLKGHIVYLRGLIAQQKRAAAISGYLDKSVMYGAGMGITRDQDKIAQAYAAYRRAGGKKALAAIGARTAQRTNSVFAY